MEQLITVTKKQRRAILRSADEHQANIPIKVIPGIAMAPRSVGETGHYETKTGMYIRHPSAYSRKGWSAMSYVASTRRVEVGELWLSCIA